MSRCKRVRLRSSIALVLPPVATVPRLMRLKERMAALSAFAISCARMPSRSVPSFEIARSRWSPKAVTAPAVASSKQRFSVWNSTALMDGILVRGEAGDDLAEIPITVDDLRHGQTLMKQVVSVVGRGAVDFLVVDDLVEARLPERITELIEKDR